MIHKNYIYTTFVRKFSKTKFIKVWNCVCFSRIPRRIHKTTIVKIVWVLNKLQYLECLIVSSKQQEIITILPIYALKDVNQKQFPLSKHQAVKGWPSKFLNNLFLIYPRFPGSLVSEFYWSFDLPKQLIFLFFYQAKEPILGPDSQGLYDRQASFIQIIISPLTLYVTISKGFFHLGSKISLVTWARAKLYSSFLLKQFRSFWKRLTRNMRISKCVQNIIPIIISFLLFKFWYLSGCFFSKWGNSLNIYMRTMTPFSHEGKKTWSKIQKQVKLKKNLFYLKLNWFKTYNVLIAIFISLYCVLDY